MEKTDENGVGWEKSFLCSSLEAVEVHKTKLEKTTINDALPLEALW